MRTHCFCCLQVTMTNVCSPFEKRTRVTWTLYWTISSLMLKSPRRIFWSQCLLWVPLFRTYKDGWCEESISPSRGSVVRGKAPVFCNLGMSGAWVVGEQFLTSPSVLDLKEPTPARTGLLGALYMESCTGTQISWLGLEMPCASPFLLSLTTVALKCYLASILCHDNSCLFHEYQQGLLGPKT